MDSTNPNDEATSSTPPTQIKNTFKLNPNAQEWTRVKQEDRCLFLTFSNSNTSTTRGDIHAYFNNIFGDCVQSISRFGGQDSPLCAKVLFKFSIIPMMVLNNSNEVYIQINGQSVLCKKYDPKKKQHHQRSIQNME
ncbi:uncharacterized protein LOC131619801 [Vicia villosa]|uniref:uncharacterized protein LOC131619801 n=1 Tax=Vicia villosa TaxID=3911 RepID=UPI00273AB862|nr:uncharacterized protein LOC131619801 [Vicia villosa]